MASPFSVYNADDALVVQLQQELNLPTFMIRSLLARGFDSVDSIRAFLSPSLVRDWLNPSIIPGMDEVVDVIDDAIRTKRHICVFGDFDLDGISATTVMTRGLRCLGAIAEPFIPRRFEEGYALTEAAFVRLMEQQPDTDLIVTVDCGIACRDQVEAIVKRGIGVVVTDHHEPSELVPVGVPLTDPKLDSNCPSVRLAGVGVALKVIQALGARFGQPHLWREYTDFASLGTIADLMPMLGENRALVTEGVALMNEKPRPCIAALLGVAEQAGKVVTSTNLSYSIIPRLNAAGRMGDAQLALDLLMSDDFDEASRLAADLDGMNNRRREIESELSEIATEKAEETYHGERALVVAGEGWHEGVKGIVASRLVSHYGVPTILFTISGDEARGSGRSVGDVNLFKAVESTQDLLTRFGGHEAAVGVTLPVANLPEFTRRLCQFMDTLDPEAFHPLLKVDAEVDLAELTVENVAKIDKLAPFGQENTQPLYLAKNVVLSDCRAVGADKQHLSCQLTDGRAAIAAIHFHCDGISELMQSDSVNDVAFELQVEEWRGRRSVKAMVKTFAQPTFEPAGGLGDAPVEPVVENLYEIPDAKLCADAKPHDYIAYQRDPERISARQEWYNRAVRDAGSLVDEIVRAFIGDGQLHDKQREILTNLEAGRNVLGVMGTGRGKSLIFQVYATLLALRNHTASLFVYPLRALISDQAFHIQGALSRFGIMACVLTGETSAPDRQRAFEGLTKGTIDIVLTTPEFFSAHTADFQACQRINFIVIDEAHHISQAYGGHREAYRELSERLKQVAPDSKPRILALTATATDTVAADIMATLPIDTIVCDGHVRDNLELCDERCVRNKDDYLCNLVARGEKTVIYVNSRVSSVMLARVLRKRVPHLALSIGFYNAGLSRDERNRVADLFREGKLRVLVATSAFGEGVNIPDIRHVVLFHLPFNEIEFNQMSGRAGRDGQTAHIHTIFSREDSAINNGILNEDTPDRDTMAALYRTLRDMQRDNGPDEFFAAMAAFEHQANMTEAVIRCGISVFEELGFIETKRTFDFDGGPASSDDPGSADPCASGSSVGSADPSSDDPTEKVYVRMVPTSSKVELSSSIRYREGLDERRIFEVFTDWVFEAPAEELLNRLRRPLVPAAGEAAFDALAIAHYDEATDAAFEAASDKGRWD